MDEPSGNLVRDHHTTSNPTRHTPIGTTTHPAHRQLHHPLERGRASIRMDRHRRRDHREGPDPGTRLPQTAGLQPESEVKKIPIDDTSFTKEIAGPLNCPLWTVGLACRARAQRPASPAGSCTHGHRSGHWCPSRALLLLCDEGPFYLPAADWLGSGFLAFVHDLARQAAAGNLVAGPARVVAGVQVHGYVVGPRADPIS